MRDPARPYYLGFEHFGEQLRGSKPSYKMTRELYTYPSRSQHQRPYPELQGEQSWKNTAWAYRDEEHTQSSDAYLLWQRDKALRNFDLSIRYFDSLDKDEFETALEHVLAKGRTLSPSSRCPPGTTLRAPMSWSSTSTSSSTSGSRGMSASGSSSTGAAASPLTGLSTAGACTPRSSLWTSCAPWTLPASTLPEAQTRTPRKNAPRRRVIITMLVAAKR